MTEKGHCNLTCSDLRVRLGEARTFAYLLDMPRPKLEMAAALRVMGLHKLVVTCHSAFNNKNTW